MDRVSATLERAASAATAATTILYLVGASVGYLVLRALYNLSPFHPLYRFPGPRIAAVSYLYEAYYDWILNGRYGRVIAEMHKTYGPLVRINPDELHCSDPYFADEVYAGSSRIRDRWQHQMNITAQGPASLSTASTISHEVHRMRRGALSRFFSRQQVLKLEGEVRQFSHLVIDKMLQSAAGGEAIDVKDVFNCFTADIISQYAFGEPMGFVAQDGWESNFATWTRSFLNSAYMLRHNSLARRLSQWMPALSDYMGADVKDVKRQLTVVIPAYIRAALKDPQNGRVFADLQGSKFLPPEEKTVHRLTGEGFIFLMAGTETTAATLTVITYHLLSQPKIYARLMESLGGLEPSNLKWTELEQRPYLWAVIQETLRMTPGVSHRSSRIARTEDLVYKSRDGKSEWVIARGTPVSMTSMINHWDEELFPNPDQFLPERWLVDGQPDYKLQKFLIAFGKGSRSCIGEQLALAEIYHMATQMALRIIPRARLYETTIDDISYDHDAVVPQTAKGSLSVRIQIE
ncbi:hypothetical protein NLU13_7342 [Sarocladium strictum]|uniref:Uncharacterized protein n=1 Tax=Sarocladium strictum TaxID=5046 RepID=A0AA39GE46_SARSR|nr:hypothetical protein NLU13_7342 [Sarocladium strictum]